MLGKSRILRNIYFNHSASSNIKFTPPLKSLYAVIIDLAAGKLEKEELAKFLAEIQERLNSYIFLNRI